VSKLYLVLKKNFFYIGATKNFTVRLRNHYHGIDYNSNRLLYLEENNLGGFHKFLWHPQYHLIIICILYDIAWSYLKII